MVLWLFVNTISFLVYNLKHIYKFAILNNHTLLTPDRMNKLSRLKSFLLLTAFILTGFLNLQGAVQPDKLKWELGTAAKISDQPSVWIPAEVPGAVQIDIAKDKKWGPFYYAENWKDYLPYEDKYYTYRTSFAKPELKVGERLFFISKGIDYEFEIYLNNEKLFHQEGMFTWIRLDLTDKLKSTNELKVLVYPVPKLNPLPLNRNQAANVTKPAVSYGWDFHPRLVPLGIWDDTYLDVQPWAYVEDVWVNYQLNNSLNAATVALTAKGRSLNGTQYTWKLLNKENKEILASSGKIASAPVEFKAELLNPTLWWPHDQGIPYLYTSVFELKDSNGSTIQKINQKVGFRRIKLVMNKGTWQEPEGYPKSTGGKYSQRAPTGLILMYFRERSQKNVTTLCLIWQR